VAYWEQSALEQLLGKSTVLACLDDGNKGYPDPGVLSFLQAQSDAKIDGALATEYAGLTFPVPNPPQLVVHASLMWARYLTYQRRPEYVKLYGKQAHDDAKAAINQLVEAREYLTDMLDGVVKPANVGGASVDGANRIYVDSPDGTKNSGDY